VQDHNTILEPLFAWYDSNKRDLPWRHTKNPYKIWLSEVILQQTRVDQGLPYYLKFVEKYPSIEHLSEASIDEVLRLWQGLGYYSRARNLHKCAKVIQMEWGGSFPETRNDLLKLPGIGRYTSAAIASLAYGKKEAVVDGNVIRVVSRLFAIEDDISNQTTIDEITHIAESLIPSDDPATFNQAMMEFGAVHCVPANPDCTTCVFFDICEARKKGLQKQIPFKKRKSSKRDRYFNYLMIEIRGKLLMKKRSGNDIWNGLFEFYLIETDRDLDFDHLPLPSELTNHADKWTMEYSSKTIKHVLSHQNIMSKFIKISFVSDCSYNASLWSGFQLYSLDEIEELPKPILIDKYLGGKIN